MKKKNNCFFNELIVFFVEYFFFLLLFLYAHFILHKSFTDFFNIKYILIAITAAGIIFLISGKIKKDKK